MLIDKIYFFTFYFRLSNLNHFNNFFYDNKNLAQHKKNIHL